MALLTEFTKPVVKVTIVIEDAKGYQSKMTFFVNVNALQNFDENSLAEWIRFLLSFLDLIIGGKIVSASYTTELKLNDVPVYDDLKIVALANCDVEEILTAEIPSFGAYKGGIHNLPTFIHEPTFSGGVAQIALNEASEDVQAYFDTLLGNPALPTLVAALNDNRGNEAPYTDTLLLKKKFRKRD